MSAPEPKWTAGPWKVSAPAGGGTFSDLFISATDPEDPGLPWTVAQVFADCGLDGDWQHNASLIAAAPALYEALAGLVGEADDGAKFSDRMKAARAALALARGEPATEGRAD